MSAQTTRQSLATLVALACCMALEMTGFAMLLPLFARRFESFGAGVQALGAGSMAYALTFAVAAPFIGMLADRFGRRPILLLSLAGYVLAFSGYLFAASTWLLILLRGLAGIPAAGLLPTMVTIVGDLVPEEKRAQWIGVAYGGAGVGYIAGPIVGGLLYDRFEYTVPFAVATAMAVGALLLALLRIPESYTPAVHPAGRRSAFMPGRQALPARSTFFLLMLITFGAMLAFALVEPQLPFYVYDDLSWTSSQLGLVLSVYAVAFMVGAFVLSRLGDRLGRRPVLVVGLALFSAQFVGLIIFGDVTGIAVSFGVAGLGNALYDPALSAIILDMAPAEHTARMIGLKSMAGSLGSLLGPALMVLITPFVRPQTVFLIASALMATVTLASGLALRLPQTSEGTRLPTGTAER